MTAPINDGGFAFPFGQISEHTGQPINGCFNPGMSLRAYFAGQALSGMVREEENHDTAAFHAVAYADALIKRLERP